MNSLNDASITAHGISKNEKKQMRSFIHLLLKEFIHSFAITRKKKKFVQYIFYSKYSDLNGLYIGWKTVKGVKQRRTDQAVRCWGGRHQVDNKTIQRWLPESWSNASHERSFYSISRWLGSSDQISYQFRWETIKVSFKLLVLLKWSFRDRTTFQWFI